MEEAEEAERNRDPVAEAKAYIKAGKQVTSPKSDDIEDMDDVDVRD